VIPRRFAAADESPDDAARHQQPNLMVRIFVIAAVVAAAMYGIAHGDVLAKARLVGTCTAITAPTSDDATLHSCRAGRLEGRPDMKKHSCTRAGFAGDAEIWRCPERVVGSRSI
jgi:hypothetical protein